MNIVSKLFCRTVQIVFRVALPILPYREPKIVPSCSELGHVFEKEKTTSVLVVTDVGIVKNGLTNLLEDALNKKQDQIYRIR